MATVTIETQTLSEFVLEALKAAREDGASITTIADGAKIHRVTLSRFLHGHADITLTVADRLCRVLELMGYIGNETEVN
jgi:plasmid maintenance system antidote protein VapI